MKTKGILLVAGIVFFMASACFFLTCLDVKYKVVKKTVTKYSIENVIAKYSDVYCIGTPLIKAIIQSESSGHPMRVRCDRKWLENEEWVIKTIGRYGLDWDNDITYSSMGLMQVLYLVAVSEGFDKDRPMDLLIVETNLKYGCAKLGEVYQRYGNTFDAISAYNWGSISTFWSTKDKCWKYKNHKYVIDTYAEYKRHGGTE